MDMSGQALRITLSILMCVSVTEALRIAAFNIKRLSENTLTSTAGRVDNLVKIMNRYDIISVEEVIDTKGLDDVVKALNRHGGPYNSIRSPLRTGTTSYKEYYAFVYRTDRVQIRDSYQYVDKNGWYERDPFAVKFHAPSAQLSDFVIVACHLKPDNANTETDHLVNVYTAFFNHFHTPNIMFNGDFNADCSYLSASQLQHNHLYEDHRFQWLLSSSVDTTVSHNTNCAYDRFVVAGTAFKAAVVPGSARVYNFEQDLHLTFQQAWGVSDHYPIEMQLKSA